MGLSDWIRETVETAQSESPRYALKHTAHALYLGGLRRLSPFFPGGIEYWDEEWDVLVILDACRPDLLTEVSATESYDWVPEPDTLETVRSPASSSQGWMAAHFDSDHRAEMAKTGYITSNMFIRDFTPDWFGVYSEVSANLELQDGVRYVDPRELTEKSIDVWRRRDELDIDRLIVHYMQPHTPFRSHPEWFLDTDHSTGWGLGFVELRDGRFNRGEFWEAYRDNLEWVLDDVDALVHNCDADIVVTSDHGNGFGEWGIYGHPNGIPLDVVREVPWVPIEGTDHRSHTPDLPDDYLDRSQTDENPDVEDQLKALGYAD